MSSSTVPRLPGRPDEQILATVREFVTAHVGGPLADDADIFATSHVSSLFAVQIVIWVERVFDFPVTGDDLDIRNFSSIAAITRFVAERPSQTAPSTSPRSHPPPTTEPPW